MSQQASQVLLLVIGFLGSVAMFMFVQRLLTPPQEDATSLTRIAPKGPGDVSAFDSLNPQGGFIDKLDIFFVYTLGLGPKLEERHMLLGKPERPNPLNLLHMKEIVAVGLAVFTFIMMEDWKAAVIAMVAGFVLPDMYFNGKIQERQREIVRNFPALVDLAALTIESGLDYMTAFERIIQTATKKTELEREVEKTINEVSLGYTRRDALRRLAMRTGIQDVRSFVGLIIQSDELGTSLVDLLRNFSSDMRFRRLNAAEKAAAQAATKMLIPIIIFIFPTVFLLVLAPMVVNVVKKGGLGF